MQRSDFTNDEWNWLLKLSRHDDGMLTLAMAARLHSLGVVEEAIGGWSVNAAGKEMIAREFAPAILRRREARARAMRTPEAIAHREHQLLMERRRGR